MMPSCDQIGVPIHFHSSTTSGSVSLMSLRILLRVFPRQSPRSAILFEMSSDADSPWLAPDFFMFLAPRSALMNGPLLHLNRTRLGPAKHTPTLHVSERAGSDQDQVDQHPDA